MSRNFSFLSILLISSSFTNLFGQINQPSVIRLDQTTLSISPVMVTAIAIASEGPLVATLDTGQGPIPIPQDADWDGFHYFISLLVATRLDQLSLQISDTTATVYIINSGPAPKIELPNTRIKDGNCDDPPPMISQSIWREGLTAPNYTRSFHEVKHLIIHHSAGSNSATNYTQVVRDIYLYHTEVNGWSDIGYNYLIAQDGTLFSGRDPGEGDQSLVKGAHFCGANTNTLGICLLGNYENAVPTSDMISKLESLLVYESIKNELNPIEEQMHSTGILSTIAGHRDGCATLCPGENTYVQLDEIRNEVLLLKISCSGDQLLDFTVNHEILGINQVLRMTNLSQGYQSYQWYFDGHITTEQQNEYSFGIPGSYDIGLIGTFLGQTDTLIRHNIVKVSWLEQEPIIFPNPSTDRVINIDYRPDITKVSLSDLNGKICLETTVSGSSVILPLSLKSGVYQLTLFTSEGETKYQKIIIK